MDLVLATAAEAAGDPDFPAQAHRILSTLVANGADLQKIAVAPDAQGCGVGRALVGALIADARAARIEVLTLDCRADNANALHLYQESGFTEYGRLKKFVAFGDRRYDKVLLSLDLRGTGPA
jgi:ribosomal protein S18 acetylase RimI-like enzyme